MPVSDIAAFAKPSTNSCTRIAAAGKQHTSRRRPAPVPTDAGLRTATKETHMEISYRRIHIHSVETQSWAA